MTEDDSNDEKSGTEVDSCVKGSRTRKAVTVTSLPLSISFSLRLNKAVLDVSQHITFTFEYQITQNCLYFLRMYWMMLSQFNCCTETLCTFTENTASQLHVAERVS